MGTVRSRPTVRTALAAGTVAGAAAVSFGCGAPSPATTSPTPAPAPMPSVLAAKCLDPAAPPVGQVPGPAAGSATGDRFERPLSIDQGALTIAPPPASAAPRVAARLAECNMTATSTAQNFPVADEVRQNGLTFGLAVVTVRDDLLRGHSASAGVTGTGIRTAPSLRPYHQRLAWVAITDPVLISNGGGTSSGGGGATGTTSPGSAETPTPTHGSPSPHPTASPAASNPIGAYQVLVIDADTGSDGLLLSTSDPGVGAGGPVRLDALLEHVSLTWTLISFDAGRYSATITMPLRSCDGAPDAVLADRTHPDLVTADISRPSLTAARPPTRTWRCTPPPSPRPCRPGSSTARTAPSTPQPLLSITPTASNP